MSTYAPFVNRDVELGNLERSRQHVSQGQPRVCVLRGEAGIGKTRLLREFLARSADRGFSYWYGQGYEDLRLPYRPFVEALLPQAAELELAADDPALIRRFLGVGPRSDAAGSADQTLERQAIFVSVSRAVMGLATHAPRILVLDDLHWADRPSIDLFEHVVFALAQTAGRTKVPLMVVGTLRPGSPSDRVSRMAARIDREPIADCLDLAGLSEEHTNDLIEGLGVARPSHQLVATVREATRGNPLFVEGVLHDLETRGALQERGGFAVSELRASEIELPEDVTSAIARRTRRLADATHRLLTFAAFLGLEVELETLSELTGADESTLLEAHEESMRERLVESAGGDAFRFSHPLIRHVLYREPSEARRQRIHARIARHLEERGRLNEGNRLLDLAHHLIRAGSQVEPERVVEHARRASYRAFSICAWDVAARFCDAALEAGSSGVLSERERADLHYRAGYAYNRDFDVGPCLDHYERAIEAFRGLGDPVGVARVQQEKTRADYTFGSVAYGKLADVEPLERALEALGDGEPRLLAAGLDTLANAYWTARRQDRAEELGGRALEIARDLGDDALSARVCGTLALAKLQILDLREALEISKKGLEYARRSGDVKTVEQRMLRIPLWLFWLGRTDEAEAMAREAWELKEATHDLGESSLSIAASVSIAVARGDFEAAENLAREVMGMVRRSHYPWAAPIALFSLACARALRGLAEEAADALDLLLEPGRVFDDPTAFKGTVDLYRELVRTYADPSGAPPGPVRARSRRLGPGGFDISVLSPLCAEVELSQASGAAERARELYEPISFAAERGVVFTYGWVFLVPRVLGVAATLEGRFEAADSHFQTAVDLAEAQHAQPELGRALLDRAAMLAARDADGDRDQAARLLERADSIFEELEMHPFRARVAENALALGVSLPVDDLTERSRELSQRDVAVLDQVARGRSDADIAHELLLSKQTVVRHVDAVFEKIDVDGRTAATAYALERGLGGTESVREAVEYHREAVREEGPLTILVSDIEGSTELMERLGDVGARDLLHAHNVIVRACIHAHAGSEIQQTGDGFLMYFHSASQAVACAVSMQRRFAHYNLEHAEVPLLVRIGVHAGHPLPDEGRLVGIDVNTAARICSTARSGEILVSETVRALARNSGFEYVDHGPKSLKGRSQRFQLFGVAWQTANA